MICFSEEPIGVNRDFTSQAIAASPRKELRREEQLPNEVGQPSGQSRSEWNEDKWTLKALKSPFLDFEPPFFGAIGVQIWGVAESSSPGVAGLHLIGPSSIPVL